MFSKTWEPTLFKFSIPKMFNALSFILFGIMLGGFIFLSYKSVEFTKVFPENGSSKISSAAVEHKSNLNVLKFFR